MNSGKHNLDIQALSQALNACAKADPIGIGRIILADARDALPGMSRDAFDAAIVTMMKTGKIALFPEDDPAMRTARGTAAAVSGYFEVGYLI